jgi:hypothetical protein
MFRGTQTISAADLAIAEGEASCFHHAGKRAATACSQCGRFLCALCAVDLNGVSFCPSCVESGASQKKIRNLENRRTLWDSIALGAAAGPIVFAIPMIYFWFLTGPLALFVGIRYWNAPSSIVPRNKWRFILAIVLSLAQLVGFAFLLFAVVLAVRTNPGLLRPRPK